MNAYELFNCLYKNIDISEQTLKLLRRNITRQQRRNRIVGIFMLDVAWMFWLTYQDQKKLKEEIARLEQEVKEMKHPEGE